MELDHILYIAIVNRLPTYQFFIHVVSLPIVWQAIVNVK